MQEPRQWRPGILCIPDCVELTDVAFSDDGLGIVAASESALLRWALPEWKLCVSPFNRTRLAVSGSTLVTIRRCPEHPRRACPAITTADATFKCTFCPPEGEGPLHAAEARSVAASANGKLVASAGYRYCCLWDTASARRSLCFVAHRRVIDELAFSPDGGHLATRSFNEVRVWDTRNGALIAELAGVSGPCSALVFASATRLITGYDRRSLIVWNWQTDSRSFLQHAGDGFTRAVSLAGRYLAAAGQDHVVRIWDWERGDVQVEWRGPTRAISVLRFSPDAQCLIAAAGRRLHIWSSSDVSVPSAALEAREAPTFPARTVPSSRARANWNRAGFAAHLKDVRWFQRIGQASDWDAKSARLSSWDSWEGPEVQGSAVLGEDQQRWFDTAVEAARTYGLFDVDARFKAVYQEIVTAARALVPEYDEREDSYHPPTISVHGAAYTGALIACWLDLGWPVPDDLLELWCWYEAGHWPCGYALSSDGKSAQLIVY